MQADPEDHKQNSSLDFYAKFKKFLGIVYSFFDIFQFNTALLQNTSKIDQKRSISFLSPILSHFSNHESFSTRLVPYDR